MYGRVEKLENLAHLLVLVGRLAVVDEGLFFLVGERRVVAHEFHYYYNVFCS